MADNAKATGSSSSSYGSESGWVKARTHCDHLNSLSSDLTHIPPPDRCTRCHHPNENWLCLGCKEVLCSRFINKHMLSTTSKQIIVWHSATAGRQ